MIFLVQIGQVLQHCILLSVRGIAQRGAGCSRSAFTGATGLYCYLGGVIAVVRNIGPARGRDGVGVGNDFDSGHNNNIP